MERRRDRHKKTARRTPFLKPKPIILVVTEGDVTEPNYLRGFAAACHNPRVTIQIADEHGTPKTAVEIAKRLKKAAEKLAKKEGDRNIAYDAVWAVFDVDSHPKIEDAVQQAKANNIKLAISNPCIEVWLLIHFAEHAANRSRVKVREQLKKFLPRYDKDVAFAKDFAPGYKDAVVRAIKMTERAVALEREHHEHNPSTGFYLLTERIKEE